MKKQTLITSLFIITIVSLLSVVIFGSKNKNTITKQDTQGAISTFFYGNTCPHCAEVETWIKENKVEDKISIVKKEVYDNQQNAAEMTKAAQDCGLPTDSIGVPFLYAEGKCLVGTPDVIGYLSEKAGIK